MEPVHAETLRPEASIEGLDKHVVGRLGVLVFQGLQPPHLRRLKPVILFPPVEVGRLANSSLPTDIGCRHAVRALLHGPQPVQFVPTAGQVPQPRACNPARRLAWQLVCDAGDCFGLDERDMLPLQNATAQEHSFRQAGTLESWQQSVGRYAVGNSRLVLAISAAFAGPLIGPCAAEAAPTSRERLLPARAPRSMSPVAFGVAVMQTAMFAHGARQPTAWRAYR